VKIIRSSSRPRNKGLARRNRNPVASHIQYRLTEEAGGTRLTFTHKAIGLISQEHMEGVQKGWGEALADFKAQAEAEGKR
jgi:Activator of Hsp90 ATPase homolog 1-like protein